MIDLSIKTYELYLWVEDEEGDGKWSSEKTNLFETLGATSGSYSTYTEAFKWYEIYKARGYQVRIVESQCIKSWENGAEYD